LAHAFAYVEAGKKKPTDERLAEAAELVEKAYKCHSPCPLFVSYRSYHSFLSQLPDWVRIVDCLLNDGISKLPEKIQLTVGIPFQPMLAQPTKGRLH